MARPATGQVIETTTSRGRVYALRFRAYGKRHYLTLDVGSHHEAEQELANVLADVRRGIWQPPGPAPVVEVPAEVPTFHEFASQWIADRESELGARTIEDYKWALSNHLLPFFARHRVDEITVREVDRYRTTKLAEGALSANSINKTLTRLSQVLALAVEYDLIPANPAAGKRRRAKGTKPRRPYVEAEQLMTMLDAAAAKPPLLAGRGRALLATLAGAGLRIDEALSLERRHVNLARGTLTIAKSKTDAGVRVVDLTPALRDELATYLDRSPWKSPTDLVFPTSSGRKDTRQNVRKLLFLPVIERANKKLAERKIELIGSVRPHGLRRTYASLRAACGDDLVFISRQLGHEDVRFTLNVYAQAVKRRERMTDAERAEFDRAVEWSQWAVMGSETPKLAPLPESAEVALHAESAD
jgi:integrase